MFVEGRIETTNWQEITVSPVPFGLDMAEKRRLLDQRNTFQTKCQVASRNKNLFFQCASVDPLYHLSDLFWC